MLPARCAGASGLPNVARSALGEGLGRAWRGTKVEQEKECWMLESDEFRLLEDSLG